MRFFDMFSAISLSACGGIQVCTKEARFRVGEPSGKQRLSVVLADEWVNAGTDPRIVRHE